ncbi:MAG: biotin carboxylase N-terminal domain-containing protein [Janthinobacterium lividum]
MAEPTSATSRYPGGPSRLEQPRFSSLLVANRGEIAVRVLRTARALGLHTVAVYSDADRGAPHVRLADEAVRLGPTPAAESYLSVTALLAAAERTGAQAVHPGYGFLSERADFARSCAQASLVFVGPSPEAMELLGRKDSSRRVALAAGVPVVPAVEAAGSADGEALSDGELAQCALDEVGLPLMVKAAAGGGGKGMRVVREAGTLREAIAAARREAVGAFGDGTLLVERYVERGRHVEVQVMADEHGTVLHLFERDCSAQRRHQKVLEEAPAPTISQALREVVTGAAVTLVREAGYTGAGTVEFLVDDAAGATGQQAYLLEVNTRLQVEHPVTELVTGLDLVALQLLVAQGLPLPLTQEQVRCSGHAIEARVYAEDPAAGFLPQAGTARRVRWPTPSTGSSAVRVDAALESGAEVSTAYDPMLGKVIASGPDRESARRGLAAALAQTVVTGLTTNTAFLRALVASDAFRDGSIDTVWLDREADAVAALIVPAVPSEHSASDHPGSAHPGGDHPGGEPPLGLVVAAWWMATAASAGPPAQAEDPFACRDGWRAGGPPAPFSARFTDGRAVHKAAVTPGPAGIGSVRVGTDAWPLAEVSRDDDDGLVDLRLEVDGRVVSVVVEPLGRSVADGGFTVTHRGATTTWRPADERAAVADVPSDGAVLAPMPGVVTTVAVTEGDDVTAGDVLGVLEAMKMELPLRAPVTGRVSGKPPEVGEHVPLGRQLFLVLSPGDGADGTGVP